tara:strand:+ start:266 stop:427 length:162 start_codon:yes stop_codon:yes gene_type:complete
MNQNEINDSIGDSHLIISINHPVKTNSFDTSDDGKIENIEKTTSSEKANQTNS